MNYTLPPISFNTPSPFQVRSEITKHLEIRYLGIVEINVCDNQNDVRILYAYVFIVGTIYYAVDGSTEH